MKRKSENKIRRMLYGCKPVIFTRDNIRALEKLSCFLCKLSGKR